MQNHNKILNLVTQGKNIIVYSILEGILPNTLPNTNPKPKSYFQAQINTT